MLTPLYKAPTQCNAQRVRRQQHDETKGNQHHNCMLTYRSYSERVINMAGRLCECVSVRLCVLGVERCGEVERLRGFWLAVGSVDTA